MRTYGRRLEEVGPEDVAVNEPMFLTGDERAGTGVHLSGAPRRGYLPRGGRRGGRKGRHITQARTADDHWFSLLISSFMHRHHTQPHPPLLPCPLAPAPDSPIIFVTRIPRSARREDARSPKFLS
ncbi:hypothetical protein P5V15_007344 [Pogonomyrmex californicus]